MLKLYTRQLNCSVGVCNTLVKFRGTGTACKFETEFERHTLKLAPHICATSNKAAFSLQWMLESMMLSLYWIGMDQPGNGTIFPARR